MVGQDIAHFSPSHDLMVLLEDNHLLCVFKPAGVLTQGDRSGDPSLMDLARTYLMERYQKPGNAFVGLVHRLDRPVSGVVVLAKTSKAASRLSEQFRSRSVRKLYRAEVAASLTPGAWAELTHYLGRDALGESVRVSPTPFDGAKRAELRYTVVFASETSSVLEVELLTGRKHQIRAQLAHEGLPIVGDRRYGLSVRSSRPIALVCSAMEFDHPVHPHRVRVAVPLGLPRLEWAHLERTTP